MSKRRLPVLNSPSGAEPSPEEAGSVAAWAGVAFFCTLLTWLPLAALVHRITETALEATLRGQLTPANTTRVALAALLVAHLAAYAASVGAGAFVVGRFGGAAPERSVFLGVAVLVGFALSFVGAGSFALALGATLVLAPIGIAAVRIAFRVGRHKRAKGI
jgi:hypothetical protein